MVQLDSERDEAWQECAITLNSWPIRTLKECIYEGAVLPVCGRPVAVVTEIHPVPARDVVTYGPELY